jgi:ABC-type Fe3+-hydroxamate transport system substrate-binding protein
VGGLAHAGAGHVGGAVELVGAGFGRRCSVIVRIVSLCPSTTETLVDLGLASSLVGVTRFCIHPAEVVRGLRKVGGTKDPDVEGIVDLAPDLVLMNAEENRREDHAALAARLRVDVSHPRRVDEVPALLRRWGALTGTEARAEARATEVEDALAALSREAEAVRPWRYLYVIWRGPWMAAGQGTYISDLLARAGGVNVVEAPDYPVVDPAALAPDVVLMPDEPFPFADKHRPELGALLPAARLELVSGDDACWHGVRTLRGLAWLRALVAQRVSLAAEGTSRAGSPAP